MIITPAILATTEAELVQQLEALAPWATSVHLDLTDGNFVPTKTLDLASLSHAPTTLRRCLHAMVKDALPTVALAEQLGFEEVIVHVETLTTEQLLALSPRVLVAINPSTPLERLGHRTYTGIVVMGVEPGSQGQSFIQATFTKIAALRKDFPTTEIIVDGGVNVSNIQELAASGVDRVVVGSAIWQSGRDPKQVYEQLSQLGSSV